MCVAMGLRIDDQALQSVEHITRPLIEIHALCNDFYSYEKEKEQLQCGKGMNAAQFIMSKEGVSEKEALDFMKQKIILLEEAHNTAFEEAMEQDDLSPQLRQYLVFMRLAAGGSHFWHSTSPRYRPRECPVDCARPDGGFIPRHSHWIFASAIVLLLLYIIRQSGLLWCLQLP